MRELYGDWRDLFRGFRIALDPRKITLAIGGIILSTAAVFLMPLAVLLILDILRSWAGSGSDPMVMHIVRSGDLVRLVGELWATIAIVSSKPAGFFLILSIVFMAEWFVWAYFGTAICRIAAVEVARDERIELNEALRFSNAKYRSVFWSPIVVVAAITFFAACNMLAGLVARCLPTGLGQLLVSIPLVFALFSGFLMAILAVGLLFGCHFIMPTISAEGTDTFDVVSRSISYLYARPWRFIWCRIVAAVYGVPCIAFAALFAALSVYLGISFGAKGLGREAFGELHRFWMYGTLPSTSLGTGASVIYASWMYLMMLSVAGYAVSYLLTADTIIYMVIRKAEDGTEMTEVYEEPSKEESTVVAAAATTGKPSKDAESEKKT